MGVGCTPHTLGLCRACAMQIGGPCGIGVRIVYWFQSGLVCICIVARQGEHPTSTPLSRRCPCPRQNSPPLSQHRPACPNTATPCFHNFGSFLEPSFLSFQSNGMWFVALCRPQEGSIWVLKCLCRCHSMCSCVLGCTLAYWTPFCSHEGVGLASVGNVCPLLHGNTGLSTHGDPVFPHFCPVNQKMAPVRIGWGGVGWVVMHREAMFVRRLPCPRACHNSLGTHVAPSGCSVRWQGLGFRLG